MNKIAQDVKYRQSLLTYVEKKGVAAASRKYNKSRSYIYYWLGRYDGSAESLERRSRRPHTNPKAHTQAEKDLIIRMRRRNPTLGLVEFWFRLRANGYTRRVESLFRVMRRLGMFQQKPKKASQPSKPYEQMKRPGQRIQVDVKIVPSSCRTTGTPRLYQYTAIDECTRLRYLGAYDEQSTFSSADFITKAVMYYRKLGVTVECVQTDNGFEFTNRFSNSNSESKTLFESTLHRLGIRHKLIRPYTPRHNGKVERSHKEDQKRFYRIRRFFSLADFGAQLAGHQTRSNQLPMRPLGWLSPVQYLKSLTVQNV